MSNFEQSRSWSNTKRQIRHTLGPRLFSSTSVMTIQPLVSAWKGVRCKKPLDNYIIDMLQNCTEYVILVDKQLSFYSTFWSDPIFMPKLANTWQGRLHSRSIFNFCRFSLVFLSFMNRKPWKLVQMCILISLTNHIYATFWSDPTYMPKQANIWQERLSQGSIFADFCLFWHVNGSIQKVAVIWWLS